MRIRKLASGDYRVYAKAKNPKTGHSRNLGTFPTRETAKKHIADIAYFEKGG